MKTNTTAGNFVQLLKMGNFHDLEAKSYPKEVPTTSRLLVKLKKRENHSEIRPFTLKSSLLHSMKTNITAENFVQLLKMGNFHDFLSKSYPKHVYTTVRVLVKLKKIR